MPDRKPLGTRVPARDPRDGASPNLEVGPVGRDVDDVLDLGAVSRRTAGLDGCVQEDDLSYRA